MAVARSKVGSPASPKRLCRLTTAATSLSGCASTPLTPSDTSDQPPEGDALVGIAKKRMKRIAKLEKKGKISAGEAEMARRLAIKATNLEDIRDMYRQRGKCSACGNSSPLTCTWAMPGWLASVASMT